MVTAGQVVAAHGHAGISQASLKKSEAQVEQAQRAIDGGQRQRRAAAHPGDVGRSRNSIAPRTLVKNGFATKELFDQRQQQLDGAQLPD